MAEEGGQPQQQIQPEDPQYQLQQHIKYRRRQQIQSTNLAKLISQNLSDFKLIMKGTCHSYTTLKLRNLGIKEITDVIKNYQHLRVVDLSMNLLKEISYLLELKYVVKLDLSRNLLTGLNFLERESNFPFLRELNAEGNKIVNLNSILTKKLVKLNLNQNVINSVQDFEGHQVLQILQLRGNKIKNLKGLRNLPNLQQLYLAQNQLQSLTQLQNVPKLVKINARKNKIANLSNFPNTPSLIYLNLRQNQIPKVADLAGVAKSIKNINLLANPVQAELGQNTKKQVWMLYRNFSRINKNQVTSEQMEQFDKEYKDRLAEQQRQRLEKQAADRQARQQAERQANQANAS